MFIISIQRKIASKYNKNVIPILSYSLTSMKLHDCEAIEIEIWKCQASFKLPCDCQESSENVLRNYIEIFRKLSKTV